MTLTSCQTWFPAHNYRITLCAYACRIARVMIVHSSTRSWLCPVGSRLRRFFTPSGVRSSSDRTQFASDLASDLRSDTPFNFKQICRARYPGLLWSQAWCQTCVSGNDNHSLLITLKESQLAIQFLHYRLPLCPVQFRAVRRVNIVAKSNEFPFPMILGWDRKQVNVARYSVEDNLIDWWVGRRTHFVSGTQTVGCPRERPRSIRWGLFTPLLGEGVRRPSRASGPRRIRHPMAWKSAFRQLGSSVFVIRFIHGKTRNYT